MNDLFTKWFGPSWRTSVGGFLVAFPPVVWAAASQVGVTLPKAVQLVLAVSVGLGGLFVGLNAKDKQVHSTPDQVEAAGQVKKVEGQ